MFIHGGLGARIFVYCSLQCLLGLHFGPVFCNVCSYYNNLFCHQQLFLSLNGVLDALSNFRRASGRQVEALADKVVTAVMASGACVEVGDSGGNGGARGGEGTLWTLGDVQDVAGGKVMLSVIDSLKRQRRSFTSGLGELCSRESGLLVLLAL